MPYANSFVFLMCFSGPRMNNSCSSSERTQRAQPIGVSTGQGNNSRPLRVLPDFAQVYRFIGSVFDPKATGHLQKLKKMDPIDVETRRLLSSFFGIFDGHGGSKAAEFVAHNLENWSLNFVYDVLQGGYVDFCRGVWRKQGSPVVSRGIGDRYLKQWVKAEPKTEVFSIEPEHDLSILACNIAQPLVACKKLLDLSVS